MWTASKVKGYKNQGYEVYREVTIDVLDAKGQKIGEAHMDVVLVRGKEILYKEFKSSETASTSTDQKMAYSRLQEGKTNELRPRGPRAIKAFGGKEFPNFVAKAVDFERPQ